MHRFAPLALILLVFSFLPASASLDDIQTIPGNQIGIANTRPEPVVVLFSDDGSDWPVSYARKFLGTPAGSSAQVVLISYRKHVRIQTPASTDREAQVFDATLTRGFRYAIVLEKDTLRRVLTPHSSNPIQDR